MENGVPMIRRNAQRALAAGLLGGFALAASTTCRPTSGSGADASEPGHGSTQGVVATVFSNVNVLPMTAETVLSAHTVVVVGERIREVGPADQVEAPPGARVVDAAGRWLMPGLAEMHAHVPPGDSPPRDAVEDILFLYVANGITTIRGMLGSAYQIPLANELERGELLGPNFYVGAPSINGSTAPTPADAERLVRAHHEAGYHFQKIHPGVSRETWDRMVEVADEVGITFGGHVPADVGLVHAIETGISTVDHLDGYVQAIASDDVQAQVNAGTIRLGGLVRGVDDEKLDEIVQRTIDQDVYVVPTMYLWENLYGAPDVDAMLAQPEMKYVSARQHEAWRRQAGGGPRGTPEEVEAYLKLRKRVLKALSDADAGILMGTDSPQLFNVPGFALHRELAVMSEAGMSNYDILRSGTAPVGKYVADHLGLDGAFGTVASGQRADLLLLNANPLDDLANLMDRAGVMVRGRWTSGEEIEERLTALAAKHAGS